MKTLAVLCNVVLFTFTCFVLATDGAPTKAVYIIFTLVLLMAPALTVFVLARRAAGDGARRAAAICNVLLLGFVCWALVDQYPHPSEPGFIEYVAVLVLTPLLSAVALLRGGLTRRPSLPTAPAAGSRWPARTPPGGSSRPKRRTARQGRARRLYPRLSPLPPRSGINWSHSTGEARERQARRQGPYHRRGTAPRGVVRKRGLEY